jgi:hypothetical protein
LKPWYLDLGEEKGLTFSGFCLSLDFMKAKKNVFSPLKSIFFAGNYTIGFIHWVAGAHCWAEDLTGRLLPIFPKIFRHFFKVFLWSLEVCLLINLFGAYRGWLMKAVPSEIAMAFLLKSVIFLYIKVFWPQVFPEILPGMHVFFCPQCYKKQRFRFMPVSLRFGHYVTYLCHHCSCLVDGWGNQVFYPSIRIQGQIWIRFGQTMAVSAGMIVLGVISGMWVWGLF